MGEIKSTLDLVMERTRHLSLSDEERARQKRETFDKRLQGLLQQVADGGLTVDAARNRVAALQAELAINEPQPVAAGILDRIDPDRDNRIWIQLLAALEPSVCAPLEETLADYGEKRRVLMQHAENRLRDRLARGHGICGSAVVPHSMNDSACRQALADLQHKAAADMRTTLHAIFSPD